MASGQRLVPGDRDKRRGVVVKIGDDGLGYLRADENGALYLFTFDQIRRYGGETIAEMRVRPGTAVLYWTDEVGQLAAIEVPAFV